MKSMFYCFHFMFVYRATADFASAVGTGGLSGGGGLDPL